MLEKLTPEALASMVGTTAPELRAFLRERYPTKAPGKGGRWRLTLTMVIAAARRF
jgi:hypothetical protein